MKKLDRLILFEILPVFLVSFIVSAFVLMMQFMFLYIDEIAGKGVGLLVIMEFIFYLSLTFVPLALPISVLIATVMVYGALGERYELASAKSAGISYQRMLYPALFFSVGVAIFSFIASEYIIPVSNVKSRSRLYDMSKKKPTLNIKEGIFNTDFEGYGIRVGKKSQDGTHIQDVILYDFSSNYKGSSNIIIAKNGEMVITPDQNAFVMVLKNGKQYQEVKRYNRSQAGDEPFMVTKFERYQKVFDLSDFQLQSTNENYFKDHQSTMNTMELQATIDSTRVRVKNLQNRVDLEMSYELPFIHSSILEARKLEKQKDTVVELLEKEAIVDSALVEMDSTTLSLDSSVHSSDDDIQTEGMAEAKVDDSVFMPNRKLNVPISPDLGESDEFSWDKMTPHYLLSLPRDSLLMESIPGTVNSEIMSTVRSNIQTMRDQISYRSKQLEADHSKITKATYELHFKFALAISCILFVLIGGAMGSIVRKGGFGYSLLISIVFFVVFIMMTILFRKMAEGYRLSPILAAYLPDIILLPLGLFLVHKAVNDSKLSLDFSRLITWYNQRFGKKKRI